MANEPESRIEERDRRTGEDSIRAGERKADDTADSAHEEIGEVRKERTAEDVSRSRTRTSEDWKRGDTRYAEDMVATDDIRRERFGVPARLSFAHKLGVGVVQGIVIAALVIALSLGASFLVGPSPLEEHTARNGEIAVASAQGIRCILTISPDPERSHEDTQKLIKECYKEFDRLTNGGE